MTADVRVAACRAVGVLGTVVVLAFGLGWWVPVGAQASGQLASSASEGDGQSPPEEQAAVSVRLAHAVDEDGAGDLVTDGETGLPRLTLRPDARTATAVLRVTLVNDGDVVLHDVAATDDLFGTAAPVATLGPGEQTTLVVARTVTLEEVAGGLAGLVEHHTRVTATTPDGATVAATAGAAVILEAVLPTPQLALVATVVGDGEVVWTGAEAAADEPRIVPVDVELSNLGDVALTGVVVAGTAQDVDGTAPGVEVTSPADAPFELAPGATRVVRVELVVTPDVAAVDEPLRDGVPLREDVTVDLVATGTAEDGTSTEARTTVTVTAVLAEPVPVRDEAVDQDRVDDDEAAPGLPATGVPAAPVGLLAAAALLAGGLLLGSAAGERREQDDLGPVRQR